jgi:hypothetical protein
MSLRISREKAAVETLVPPIARMLPLDHPAASTPRCPGLSSQTADKVGKMSRLFWRKPTLEYRARSPSDWRCPATTNVLLPVPMSLIVPSNLTVSTALVFPRWSSRCGAAVLGGHSRR